MQSKIIGSQIIKLRLKFLVKNVKITKLKKDLIIKLSNTHPSFPQKCLIFYLKKFPKKTVLFNHFTKFVKKINFLSNAILKQNDFFFSFKKIPLMGMVFIFRLNSAGLRFYFVHSRSIVFSTFSSVAPPPTRNK